VNPAKVRDARVLVVDDDATNVYLLEKLLRKSGVAVVEGLTDSSLVMGRVRGFEPDIVLLDLQMPAPDGFELLDQIGRFSAAANIFLPVVVITADITEGAKERALAAGAADFLTKPFRLTETLLRLGNLVHTRRLHQSLVRHNIAIAAELEGYTGVSRDADRRRARIVSTLDHLDDELTIVFQPIIALVPGETVGHEALSRFSAAPHRPPNEWFADAAEAGLGVDLELAAARRILDKAHLLAATAFVAINVSPDTLLTAAFAELIAAYPPGRIVIELTEHAHIDDYSRITAAVTRLRRHGARLAVDDTGAGFASLAHILKLQPEFIKLDRNIVTDIDTDLARAALVGALVTFSDDTGARLIAEGIETAAEVSKVVELGVQLGQGFYLGRPSHLPVDASTCAAHPVATPYPRKRAGSRGCADMSAPTATLVPLEDPNEMDRASDEADRLALEHDQDSNTRGWADARDGRADARDDRASARDARADARDARAVARDDLATSDRGDGGAADAGDGDPAQSQQDRLRAASDRASAADERRAAAAERVLSASDRFAASVDVLTGARRRDAGVLELERETVRSKGTGRPFTVAFIDLDGLKATNGSFGHASGDRRLRRVADTLRSHLRSYDLIVRYGGDEFVCGMPDLDVEGAALRLAIVGAELATEPGESVSVGIAGLRAGESLETVIGRADEALRFSRSGFPSRGSLGSDVGPTDDIGLGAQIDAESGSPDERDVKRVEDAASENASATRIKPFVATSKTH
jgi:diguanylate cyclase (GGDEF)-like protein